MGNRPKFNDTHKWCPKCKNWLSLNKFSGNKSNLSGKNSYCKTCSAEINYQYKKDYEYRNRYGISLKEFMEMWQQQNGLCAICKVPLGRERGTADNRACVDHSHVTSKVRGLLCHKCNLGIGCFSDNIESLLAAIEYLKQFQPLL